jgi:hypothetical protein
VSYQIALVNGGTCEGPPGLRPQNQEHYYGAYFRDPDGNKLCVASYVPALESMKSLWGRATEFATTSRLSF